MIRLARFLGANYLYGVINFALGAASMGALAFVILTSIYHAGVCR